MQSGTAAKRLEARTQTKASAKQLSFGRHPSRCRNRQCCPDRRRIRSRPPRLRVSLSRNPVLGSRAYDAFGNALTVRADVTGGSYTLTTSTYGNDTANWFLGRMLTSQTRSVVGASDITRHSAFAYSGATGLMTQEVVEPGNNTCNSGTSSCTLTTGYTYDSFGNKLTAAISGSGIATRTTTNGYDAKGRFATTVTNALGQSESWTFDERFGVPTSHTGPNGLATAWTYDGFGRRTLETRPDGNKTAYITEVITVPTGLPATTAARVKLNDLNAAGASNGPGRRDYYDALLRPLGSDTTGFNLAAIRAETQYDASGRVLRSSRPYYTGGTPRWTTFTYDALGRVTRAVFPDASDTLYAYHGLSSAVTNDKGQVTATLKNAQGLVAGVTDAAGGTTAYVYDAFGNLLRVGDPAGNVTANSYDVRGRRIASSDPDLGSWSYAYNVLGQLTSQTDALAQATTLSYDLLGRVTGQVQGGVTTGWTWGTSAAAHEIGQLASTTTGSGYMRTHTYDSLGRPATTTLTIDGTAYTATTAYTGDGRADTVTYPSGFAAKYVYTSTGYLAQVKDNATAAVLWTANARDAELRLTQATLGNGVVVDQAYDANTGLVQQIAAGPAQGVANFSYAFDTIGNLASRADTFQGTTEAFCYDNLNRLTDSAFVSGGSTCITGTGRKTVSYSAIGNILSKTGIGSYGYPASGGGAGSRPHAVSSVAGTVNGAVNPAYSYDANGNMTAGAGRAVSWTAFNMAATITQGANAYAFTYDSEHQRIKQVAPGLMTLYLNAQGAMSEKLVGGSSTTWRDYLYTDGKLAAQRDRVVSTGTVTWSYFVTDHLGSAAVITSAAGTVTERLSYDAWGKRRNANGTDAVCGTITSAATRGFTGHEMLGGLCLVNMNARIYDPDLGRFMAADTHVTDPLNLQDWNAYTYVNNNPLSFTDPTGHELTVGSATVVISQDAQSRAWVADANPNCSGCGPTTSEIKDAIKGAIGIYSGMSVSPSGLKVTTVGGVVNVHLAAGKWMNTGGNNTAHPVQNSGGAQAASGIDSEHRSGSGKFANGTRTGAFAYLASNTKSQEALATRPDISGPEIPADERRAIIDNAIDTYRHQPGPHLITGFINSYDEYELRNERGGYRSFGTLKEANAFSKSQLENFAIEWSHVEGWANGAGLVYIYAAGAYRSTSLYGTSIIPSLSTLFLIWHESGHPSSWLGGGGCFTSESCANQWALNHYRAPRQ